ncbi:MAG: ATP-dependent RecD-like DNA helicase [Chloroflexi bacterium]|nr:ATP-dependent RecD-like DNA helicase [Chloroflexota bacterium]
MAGKSDAVDGNSADSSLEGVLERIVYFNEENNYTVARLQVGTKPDLTTIVGNIPCPTPGETLRLKGHWVVDSKFGRQFRVESCLTVLPSTITGIQKYLGSGLVRGIGPEMARRLVAQFGIGTLDAIDEGAEKLQEVDGIGPIRAGRIVNAWQGQKQVREIMVFLQGYGVSSTFSVKIYKTYGDKAIAIVKENPYRLALDINGIGFKTADKIARTMGIDPASRMRAEAGIIHLLSELVSDGHVYYPKEELTEQAIDLLEVDRVLIEEAMVSLVTQKRVVVEECRDHQAVYLTPLHTAEQNVAARLVTLLRWPKQLLHVDVEKAMGWVQCAGGIALAEMQKEAVRKAVAGKVLVLTGGPGTGKTTLVKSLVRILAREGQRIVLASPTGRAAKRLSEVTGMEAKTIHRLLEYSRSDGGFKRNEQNLLAADLVIIDEASMVDILLMNHLLKAVPAAATLVLVGDVDQLPSVGPGNVLKDIILSQNVETVRLSEVFRQAQQSLIVVNAHRVNQGHMPQMKPSQEGGKPDFFFIEREEPEQAVELVKELCSSRLPRAYGLDRLEDIQVMAPLHRGVAGVANLNAELQALLNPKGREVVRGGRTFRVGDKVMQIRNNYDKDVFNGDIGRIAGLDPEDQSLQVRFGDKIVDYEWSELDELVLAYAISIHKSQGSEYPAVVVPILTQHFIMLQRNLLYTAITRGKRLVVLVGSKRAIAMAVKNNKVQHRYTNLAERLRA